MLLPAFFDTNKYYPQLSLIVCIYMNVLFVFPNIFFHTKNRLMSCGVIDKKVGSQNFFEKNCSNIIFTFLLFLHKQKGSKCYPNIVFFHQRLPTPYGHSEKCIKNCKSNAIAKWTIPYTQKWQYITMTKIYISSNLKL